MRRKWNMSSWTGTEEEEEDVSDRECDGASIGNCVNSLPRLVVYHRPILLLFRLVLVLLLLILLAHQNNK